MTARRSASGLANPRRRLVAGLVVVAMGFMTVGAKLVHLQGFEATAYADQAEKQRMRRIELLADRGQIVDRNGIPLAMNVDVRLVYADPKLVEDPPGAAAKVAGTLGLNPAEVERALRRKGRYVVLARGVDPVKARELLALKVAGIGTAPETKRVYPNGGLGAGVVGFVGGEGAGLAGVEHALDKTLRGVPGEMLVEQDGAGRPIPSGERRERAPQAGTSHMLTLDRDIQWQAERTLAEQVRKSGAKGGTAIVMSVRTGEILALATTPSFDPNDPTKASRSVLGGNPAVSLVYEPGSVNKMVVAAAALESGRLGPTTPVLVTPTIQVADKAFRDVHPIGTKHLTFTGVIAKSSNVGTIRVAQGLGDEVIYDYLRRFGFGERTGVSFPGESGGLLPHFEDWSGSQSGTVPIGQGVSATALQIANAYATIANGGVRLTPTLVRGALDADGKLLPSAPRKTFRAVSPETASKVSLMLEAVTNEGGTATAAAIPGYRVAGKTGTARKVRPDGRGYSGHIASFVGFAPADAPELVVSVSLDEPGQIYGGLVAAPVFRSVMGFALARLHVPPTGRPAPPPVKLVLD